MPFIPVQRTGHSGMFSYKASIVFCVIVRSIDPEPTGVDRTGVDTRKGD